MTNRRWTVAEIHTLRECANAAQSVVMSLLPGRSWRAVEAARQRYGIARQNNIPAARVPRRMQLLDDLTRARVAKRLPQKCIEAKIGQIITYLEPGHRDPSFRLLLRWCDALDLELRAVPKGMEAAG